MINSLLACPAGLDEHEEIYQWEVSMTVLDLLDELELIVTCYYNQSKSIDFF